MDTEDLLHDIVLNSLPMKDVRHFRTCLLDLPDEIILLICRYLTQYDVLHSFYTPERPEFRLHRLISDYYTTIKLDQTTFDEYTYFTNLFSACQTPLRPSSLILSNEHVPCLTNYYLTYMPKDTIQSIFANLKRLTLLDGSAKDLKDIYSKKKNLSQLEYLHINILNSNQKSNENSFGAFGIDLTNVLFKDKIPSLHTVFHQNNDGMTLEKTMKSHQNLRNVHLFLQTIDDLFILLNGLIPNVQILIIQLCKSRILSCHRPQATPSSPLLTEFTLLHAHVGLVMDDITCIFGSMPNLIQLTLSIRDTPDPTFCHGPIFESILSEYLPHLQKFDYTMTHRMSEKTLVEDFLRYSMNNVYYGHEDVKWIHIYSLPWPSHKDDKRPIAILEDVFNTSVQLDVTRSEYIKNVLIRKHDELSELKKHYRRAYEITSCISIDIELPLRISKLILSKEISISSINNIPQPSIRHLIVKHRLTNENEISMISDQFPHVKYLSLLLPLDQNSFIGCLKNVFRLDDRKEKRCYLSELINFSTEMVDQQHDVIWNGNRFTNWFIANTELKYYQYRFLVDASVLTLSFWF